THSQRRRQYDAHAQAAAGAVVGADRAAQRLDVAADDPQAEASVLGAAVLRRVRIRRPLRPHRVVAVEDAIDLGGVDARALVVDLQLDAVLAAAQADRDAAARRREADGVVEDVLHHGLQHAAAGTHLDALVEVAGEPEA